MRKGVDILYQTFFILIGSTHKTFIFSSEISLLWSFKLYSYFFYKSHENISTTHNPSGFLLFNGTPRTFFTFCHDNFCLCSDCFHLAPPRRIINQQLFCCADDKHREPQADLLDSDAQCRNKLRLAFSQNCKRTKELHLVATTGLVRATATATTGSNIIAVPLSLFRLRKQCSVIMHDSVTSW